MPGGGRRIKGKGGIGSETFGGREGGVGGKGKRGD